MSKKNYDSILRMTRGAIEERWTATNRSRPRS